MSTKLEIKIVGLVFAGLIIASLILGFMSTRFIRTDVHSIVDSYSDLSLNFIMDAVKETMVSGNPEITKKLINKKTKTGQITHLDELIIINSKGQEAFSGKRITNKKDLVIIKDIRKQKSRKKVKTEDNIIYYTPIFNTERCVKCHEGPGSLLGVMKASVSIKAVREKVLFRTKIILLTLLLATILFGLILWMIFRYVIITPIRKIEASAEKVSDGDLSFEADINSVDEIGRLNSNLMKAFMSIRKIIERVREVSFRVAGVTKEIENGSKEIIEGTHVEHESVNNVLKSVEEFNSSITTVNMVVEDFSVAAIDGVTASNEMLANTKQINENTIELSEAVDSTSSSIEEISANIKDVAQRAEELSTSAEEAVSAIGEINLSIREIKSSTQESSKLAEKTVSDASMFGMAAVQKTADGMEKIKVEVLKTADFIEKLDKRSKDIGKIIDVIDDITDQASLLSFNAAILAAQSGEHGKGFSVVADEIKGLAERTSFSTQEIASLIQSVQSEVNYASTAISDGIATVEDGSKLTAEAKKAFEKIMDNLNDSTKMTQSVEQATSEQSESINFVSNTMERVRNMIVHIAKATSEYSDGITQIVLASEKITTVTQTVKNSTVAQLKRGKELAGVLDSFSKKALDISTELKKAKFSSDEILKSMGDISAFPERNRNKLFNVNRNIRDLMSDAEVLIAELKHFKSDKDKKKNSTMSMGVIPLESPAEMYKRFLPLSNYLSEKLNKQVELKVEVDYDNTINNIGEGITDLCYMTPSTYIKAKQKYGVEVLLKALRHGKPYQRIVIISRKGGKIRNVSDIKGNSFAFGDLLSTSSYIIPRIMLHEEGINLEDLSFHDFLGHHDDVAKAVLKGDFDAGGIMESAAEEFKDKGLKLLKYSMNVPEFNICVKKEMPEELKSAIKQTLLDLTDEDNEGKMILQSISPAYTGFVEAQHDDYKEIMEAMKKLKIL